jgi:hypothetical protein
LAVIFNQLVRHGRIMLMPGSPVAFEDPDAESYFVACGWGEVTAAEPVYTYSQDEVSVDPLTRFGDSGKYVLPDRAEAALKAGGTEPAAAPEDGSHG